MLLNVTPTTPEQAPGTVNLNGTVASDEVGLPATAAASMQDMWGINNTESLLQDSGEVEYPARITGGWVIGHVSL
jgi:hypothetical protein